MRTQTTRYIDHIPSPIGELALVTDEAFRSIMLGFTDGHPGFEKQLYAIRNDDSISLVPVNNPGGMSSALAKYWAGTLSSIAGLTTAAVGTEFECAVWSELRNIPCGETRSYAEIARRIGRPKAFRAIGMANGKNPIGIVVPCHRVIGANGSLTGFGGGIHRKQWLLRHEGVAVNNGQLSLF